MMEDYVDTKRFDISLEDLQTFIVVSNLGGIGRAARYLNLAQPSVSNRIRRLEEKLKVSLLRRSDGGITLTPDGEKLHVQAMSALAELNDLFRSFQAGAAGKRELRLAITLMMAQIKVPCILSDFRDVSPAVEIHVHELTVVETIKAMNDGRCELALMSCEKLPDEFDHDVLVQDENVLIVSRRHPLNRPEGATLTEALSFPVLYPNEHLPQLAPLHEVVSSLGLTMTLAPEAAGVRHPLSLITMAAAGLGVFFLPRTLVPAELRTVVATVKLSDCTIARRFGLVHVRGRRLSAQADTFRNFLIAARASDLRTWPDGQRAD